MRTLPLVVVALFVAGCASSPASTTAVYDHKYNTYSFVKNPSQNEFVGTAAAADTKAKPGWYRFGHP